MGKPICHDMLAAAMRKARTLAPNVNITADYGDHTYHENISQQETFKSFSSIPDVGMIQGYFWLFYQFLTLPWITDK